MKIKIYIKYNYLLKYQLLETYSYSHDISNVVATVKTVSGADSIVSNASPAWLKFRLSSSIAYLSINGTETFNILAVANKPSANVTRFLMNASSYTFNL